jgi:hypothetical protein
VRGRVEKADFSALIEPGAPERLDTSGPMWTTDRMCTEMAAARARQRNAANAHAPLPQTAAGAAAVCADSLPATNVPAAPDPMNGVSKM